MTTRRIVGGGVAGLLVGGLLTYCAAVGLDDADKTASVVCAVLAVLALIGPYLLPAPTSPAVRASGPGAVAVSGDSSADVSTSVSGTLPPGALEPNHHGVGASGPGSVAVGGTNTAPIRTEIRLWQ